MIARARVARYLFDHRNGSMLRRWLVDEYILGPTGVGNDNISGVFIDECGVRLQLPKLPVMTAQCFFHKFFARESFRRHDRFVVAQACLFLAAKVEESAVSLRSLVRECHGVRYAGKSRAPLDESSERDVKRAVVMAERAVLYARRGVSFRLSLRAAR